MSENDEHKAIPHGHVSHFTANRPCQGHARMERLHHCQVHQIHVSLNLELPLHANAWEERHNQYILTVTV